VNVGSLETAWLGLAVKAIVSKLILTVQIYLENSLSKGSHYSY